MHVIENFSLADFLHCCVMNYCAGDVVCSESGQAFIHVNGIYLLGLNLIEPQCFTSYCNNIDIETNYSPTSDRIKLYGLAKRSPSRPSQASTLAFHL